MGIMLAFVLPGAQADSSFEQGKCGGINVAKFVIMRAL
jgi:hypothetical protein